VLRVLVCDDDAATRFILKRILLRDHAVAVTEAADGRDAIARLTNEPFDLLILDLCMPVVDGVATLSMIRERPMLGHLPVVILSAERRSDAVESVIRLGSMISC
jgi:CheY-like chemotaxis protein